MRRTAMVSPLSALMLLLVVFLSSSVFGAGDIRIMKAGNESENRLLDDPGLQDFLTSAQVDTYCIVWYDFEQMDWQGWTREDATAQRDTFWHVDLFMALDGTPF